MKIEQLIVQHLYNTKSVTLQGIGTILLNPSVVLPTEADKDFTIPENAFSFNYNLKAGEDEGLINFIVQQTRKIKPLASSDLESYSILAKQFLNIGKPLLIEGVGTIQKNQAGIYEFIQGHFVAPKIDDVPRQLKEKTEENISFESESRRTGNGKKYLVLLFISLFVIMAALGIYFFIFNKKTPAKEAVAPTQTSAADSMHTADTTKKIAAATTVAITPAAVTAPADSFNFKVVIREYKDSVTANEKLKKFGSYGYKLLVIKRDSTKYLLAMPFTKPLADTVRVRDSLKHAIFGGEPYVIIK